MGNRLSSIATRTGDGGSTGLGDGSRISKADPRVAAMGDVDELNSAIGMLLAISVSTDDPPLRPMLRQIQQDLFDLGGELCIPGHTLLKPERVAALDDWLKSSNATLPRLQEFILPGGSVQASQAHICRTICRRAERTVVELAEGQTISDTVRQYLNRLSDLLFVIARLLNRSEGATEPQWERDGVQDSDTR